MTGFVWHVFESTGEDSRPNISLTKSVPVSLLAYPKSSQANKIRFILDSAMQFGKVEATGVLFRFGERNTIFLSRF